MTWTGQLFSVGQILTAAQMNNLQADITALANGDAGSPSIVSGALSSTSGEVSTSSVNGVNLGLPGGDFGFYPRIKTSNVAYIAGWGYNYTTSVAKSATSTTSTSYVTSLNLAIANAAGTAYMQQTYIQASPPYNLGDGNIPLFIFAIIDNGTGEIESLYLAPEAPWHYNGPTNIRPDTYINGMPFNRIREIEIEPDFRARLLNPVTRPEVLGRLSSDPYVNVEITQDVKNADMDIIPHPFLDNGLIGKTVIMFDPVCDCVQDLFNLHQSGELVSELFYGKHLIFGNTPIQRNGPQGLMIVDLDWKLTP